MLNEAKGSSITPVGLMAHSQRHTDGTQTVHTHILFRFLLLDHLL